eukprot:1383420-Amphidinium_carterae.1
MKPERDAHGVLLPACTLVLLDIREGKSATQTLEHSLRLSVHDTVLRNHGSTPTPPQSQGESQRKERKVRTSCGVAVGCVRSQLYKSAD